MSAGKDVREIIAVSIRTLERDGDEHGVAEDLHEVGAVLSLLIDAAEAVAGSITVQPENGTPMHRLDLAITRATGGAA